jgi:hypothetical protein
MSQRWASSLRCTQFGVPFCSSCILRSPAMCALVDLHFPALKRDLVSACRKIVRCLYNVSRDILPDVQLGQGYLDGSDHALSLQVHSSDNTLDEHGFTNRNGNLNGHKASGREGTTPATCVPELQGLEWESRTSHSDERSKLGMIISMVPRIRAGWCDLCHIRSGSSDVRKRQILKANKRGPQFSDTFKLLKIKK